MTTGSVKKRTRKKVAREDQFVTFEWEGREYTLDVVKDRVYKNWMAVETNVGFTILGAYRQQAAETA